MNIRYRFATTDTSVAGGTRDLTLTVEQSFDNLTWTTVSTHTISLNPVIPSVSKVITPEQVGPYLRVRLASDNFNGTFSTQVDAFVE